MAEQPRQERRSRKRFGVKQASVQYSSAAGLLSFLKPRSAKHLVLNISESGMHFMTKEQLKESDALSLTVEAPLIDTPIKISGKIIWVQKSKEYEAYRVGVQFTKTSEASLGKLKHIINNSVLDKIDVTTTFYFKESDRLKE